MRSLAPVFLFLSFSLTVSLLPVRNATAQSVSQTVYTNPERQPEFPGGKAALSQYLASTIRFPNALLRKSLDTGPVAAKFIIERDGSVRDVRVTTKPVDKKMQKGMQDFIKSIISSVEAMPRWRPGEVGNRPVPVFYTLPIEVNLQ